MTYWAIFFGVLGVIALALAIAVDRAVRGPDLRAQRRAEMRSFLRTKSVARRRMALVPHDEYWANKRIEPLDPSRPVNLSVVPTPAPMDKR